MGWAEMLFHKHFLHFRALAADIDASLFGLCHAYALKVEELYGSIVVGSDVGYAGAFGDGEFAGWSEDTTDMPLRLKDGDTYTGTYNLTAETSYFKLKAGSYVYSTGGGDVAVELGKEYTTAKTGNAFSLPAGEYTFTYVMAKNADTGKLTVTKGAGIADITADDNAPVEDGDFARRLTLYGLNKRHLKFAGLVWHLWHEDKYMYNKDENIRYSIRENCAVRCFLYLGARNPAINRECMEFSRLLSMPRVQ